MQVFIFQIIIAAHKLRSLYCLTCNLVGVLYYCYYLFCSGYLYYYYPYAPCHLCVLPHPAPCYIYYHSSFIPCLHSIHTFIHPALSLHIYSPSSPFLGLMVFVQQVYTYDGLGASSLLLLYIRISSSSILYMVS